MDNGTVEVFDGLSFVMWTPDDRICLLKEYGCNENRYDPYQNGETPRFRDEAAMWFKRSRAFLDALLRVLQKYGLF